MTQEQKDLLLKDLCARLPYGVKIVIQDTFKYSIVSREYHILDISNFSDIFCFNYKKFDKSMKKAMRKRPNDIVIKPYLFPISSMTKEQEEEYYSLQQKAIYNSKGLINSDVMEYVNWCYKNYIDINNLIPIGLANDATGLGIY